MKIIIRGGSVYDGKGGSAKKIDILIRNEKIVGLGEFAKKNAEVQIDASKRLIFPGFIDAGTDFDRHFGIFNREVQDVFLSQGITTVIGGNHGLSLAPFTGGKFLREFPALNNFGAVFHWRSFGEFADILSKAKLRLNFGSLAGYLNLKKFGAGVSGRDLTFSEQEKLISVLKKTLFSGAFGVSINLCHKFTRSIPKDEVREVSAVMARMKRPLSLDIEIEGISKETRKADYLKNLLLVFKEAGVSVVVTGLHNPLKNEEGDHKLFREIIRESSSEINIGLQMSPLPCVAVPITSFLPEIFQENNPRKKFNIHREISFKKEIIANILPRLSKIISVAGTPKNISSFRGRTLEELSDSLHLPKEDALLFLMESSRLGATLFYEKCSYCEKELLSQPLILLTSGNVYSQGSSVFGKEKNIPSFLKSVREVSDGSFEQAIPKITSLPARRYQVAERGVIAEGMFADIIIADENLEITHALVNGSLAFEKSENDKIKKLPPASFAGKFLKRKP